MKIYIVHYNKLLDRRKNMVMQLITNGLDAEFVTKYDRDTITEEDKKQFTVGYGHTDRAVTLSHLYCYKDIAAHHDYGLILEDDALFNNRFRETLEHYICQLPIDWDMLFIGDGCNLHIPYDVVSRSNTNVFKKCLEPTAWGGNGATRCTDSYLISKKCAEAIVCEISRDGYLVDNSVDWWLNEICRKLKFNVYWAEPTIVTQGSISIFSTSRN